MYYNEQHNQYIQENVSFTIGDTQYPSNWLDYASPEDKSALGLVEVITVGTRASERTNYVSEELVGAERRIINVPKPIEQIAALDKSDASAEIRRLEQDALMPRALREFLLDQPGASQKPWFAKVKTLDDQVTDLRLKL